MNKYLQFCFLIFFAFSTNGVFAGVQCTGNDITFTSVTITGVSVNSITYQYVLHNIGTQPLAFNKLTLNNYVSNNNTFDASDPTASGTDLSYTGVIQLAAGATYTNSYTTTFSGALVLYPYLIVNLSYSDGECDAMNNRVVVCTRPDAHFLDLAITSIVGNYVNYDFTIQNRGGDTLFFNKLILQNYFSVDNTYGQGDAAGGGSFLVLESKPYLLANEIHTGSFSGNSSALSSYSYLLAQLNYQFSECTTDNNLGVRPLEVTASLRNGLQIFDNTSIRWNSQNKNFTIDAWGSSAIQDQLQYTLYNSSGIVVASGNTRLGEITHVNGGREGMYLLVISDDQKFCSKKIIY